MGRIPWMKIFPFLLLHSQAPPSTNEERISPTEALTRRMLLFLSLARDGGLNLSVVYLFFLIVACTPGVLGVYFMLALSEGFPHLGSRALWVCIVKDFGAVLTLRMVCTCYMAQSAPDVSAHYLATEHFQPGLFACFRRWAYRLAGAERELSRPRWFSSFLGDHILLVSVGLPYIVSMALLPLCYWPELPKPDCRDAFNMVAFFIEAFAVIFRAVQSIYLAVLLMGFLYCTLEHSATFQPRSQGAARWHLFIFMALWAPQMFVIYKVHKDLHSFHGPHTQVLHEAYDRMGVLPQLFVSHSMAMMGAIMLGHHEHFHRSQDLPWKETPFIAVVLLCAAGWHYLAEARGRGQGHPDTDQSEFGIAEVYVYLFLAFRVIVGVSMLLLALYGRSFRSHRRGAASRRSGTLRVTVTKERSLPPPHWDQPLRHSISDGSEAVDEDENVILFDYDGALVLLTFVVAILFPVSLSYAMYSLGLYWSMGAEILGSLLAPLGCCVFVLVAWRRPPQKTWVWAAFLRTGILLSICSAVHHGALESCIMAKGFVPVPKTVMFCCLYPGLPDFNDFEFEVREVCKETKCQAPEEISMQLFCNEDYDYAKTKNMIFSFDARQGWKAGQPSMAFDLFETMGCIGSVELFFTLTGIFFKLTLRAPGLGHVEGTIDHDPHNAGDSSAASDHRPQSPSDTHGAQLSHRSGASIELMPRGSDAAFAQ